MKLSRRLSWTAATVAVLAAGMAVPALSANRTVLGEYFNATW